MAGSGLAFEEEAEEDDRDRGKREQRPVIGPVIVQRLDRGVRGPVDRRRDQLQLAGIAGNEVHDVTPHVAIDRHQPGDERTKTADGEKAIVDSLHVAAEAAKRGPAM